MRLIKLALVALVAVALGAPTLGSAFSAGGDQLASAAKGKRCKGKGGKGKGKSVLAGAAKKKGCGKGKGKGKGRPKPPPTPPTGTTAIELQVYSPLGPLQDQVFAAVTSSNETCKSGRTMTLYEELGASDQSVATDIVEGGSLTFTFPAQTVGDDFYVKATQDTVGQTKCAPATSGLITKGA